MDQGTDKILQEHNAHGNRPSWIDSLRTHRTRALAVAGLLVVALVGFSVWRVTSSGYVSTDDAFIDSRTVEISSQVNAAIVRSAPYPRGTHCNSQSCTTSKEIEFCITSATRPACLALCPRRGLILEPQGGRARASVIQKYRYRWYKSVVA
jgi:hypothetical protein